jgi:hypothetical protein
VGTTMNESDKNERPQRPYALLLWVLTGLVVLAFVGASVNPQSNDVPPNLRGVWRTSDSKHADRFFELSLVSVSFGTGHGTVSTGFIQKIETFSEGAHTRYKVIYADEDGDHEISIFYEPAHGTLRFQNQEQVVWEKDKERLSLRDLGHK